MNDHEPGLIARLWERHCLPTLIDKACRSGAILDERRRWIPRARGEVVEIGIGSGLNLGLYDPATVEGLVGVEPSAPLRATSEARARACAFPVRILGSPGEALALDAGRFDTAVTTYTLCSVARPADVLREIRRVLKPGGALVFVEHGASPRARTLAWQRRITPVWRRISGNCHLDRDVQRDLDEAGFRIETLEAGEAEGGLSLTSFTRAGVARPS